MSTIHKDYDIQIKCGYSLKSDHHGGSPAKRRAREVYERMNRIEGGNRGVVPHFGTTASNYRGKSNAVLVTHREHRGG